MAQTRASRRPPIGPAHTRAGGPWRDPLRGGHPDPTLLSLSGWQQRQQLLGGQTPEATFALKGSPRFCAPPPGRLRGGVVALLAEAALEAAALTVAPAGVSFIPIDLKCDYLRPLLADGRQARVEARVIHSGRRIAVGSAEVRDAEGRPVAIATGLGLFSAAGPTAVPGG